MNRLTSIDRDNSLPVETLNGLNTHMDTMNRLLIERYHRRNRFRYWLFGTDDWIGASWRSQKAAIEAERQRVKGAVVSVIARSDAAGKSSLTLQKARVFTHLA